jgi:predicted dehydrogenase
VYSENREDGIEWAKTAECRYIEHFDDLCRDPSIDGVIITDATSKHRDMICRAANSGKHVYVEKALAATNEEAYEIRDAVKKNGIHFAMSDPAMRPPQMFAKKLFDEGKFGEITEIRARFVHDEALKGTHKLSFYNKKEAGGGAMIDMGCHCVHVLHQFLGKPLSAVSLMHSFGTAAQNSGLENSIIAVYKFKSGALGIAETSWYAPRWESAFDIYGTKGCVSSIDNRLCYRLENSDWITLAPEELPPGMVYPLNYWIDSIIGDTPNTEYGIDEAVELTEMISAAYKSAENGIAV